MVSSVLGYVGVDIDMPVLLGSGVLGSGDPKRLQAVTSRLRLLKDKAANRM
jgi:hypothetical protein